MGVTYRRKNWTPEARQALSKSWTPEKREVARQRNLATAEQRRATYAERYPERAAVYELAMQSRQPCDGCGSDAALPFFALEPYALAGWRCVECRKSHPTNL
jgi:hypothetical protein